MKKLFPHWNWEDTMRLTMVTVALSIFLSIFFNLIQEKKFNGYYMYTGNGKHTIFINWENRIDERAFYSYDEDVAMKFYKELKELEK